MCKRHQGSVLTHSYAAAVLQLLPFDADEHLLPDLIINYICEQAEMQCRQHLLHQEAARYLFLVA